MGARPSSAVHVNAGGDARAPGNIAASLGGVPIFSGGPQSPAAVVAGTPLRPCRSTALPDSWAHPLSAFRLPSPEFDRLHSHIYHWPAD